MSAEQPTMAPARRRPIPGMSSSGGSGTPPPIDSPVVPSAPSNRSAVPNAGDDVDTGATATAATAEELALAARPRSGSGKPSAGAAVATGGEAPRRRPAADYATTRLVNFRIPVDLHDRFRQLVREAERAHLRLRHPSLTELIIALLEEGPETADEVAELIRRKRAAEHEEH
jgi:hypothetical protein